MAEFVRYTFVALALILGTAGVTPSPARAQEVTLRLGHIAPPQGTYQQAAERFAGNLETLSGGTMAVDIVPGGALGDLGQLWVQTRAGALDLHLIDLGAMIAMQEARSFMVLWVPFLFEDQDHFRRFAASGILTRMMDDAEASTGLVYLGLVGDRPPRALSTVDTPVRTVEDMAGLKIRTPEHPLIIAAFEEWGAAPTPLPAPEVFTALRTGLVDGQDNGVLDFLDAGFAEVQSQYMPLDYIHSGIGLWMGGPTWARMDETQRGWLRAAAEMSGAQGAVEHDAAMTTAMAALSGRGVTVTQPDRESFRAVVDGLVADMDGEVWPAGLAAEIGGL